MSKSTPPMDGPSFLQDKYFIQIFALNILIDLIKGWCSDVGKEGERVLKIIEDILRFEYDIDVR